MSLKNLNDQEIESGTELALGRERLATTTLLHYLCEMDARKLYARRGFSSLFEYCVKKLKMSEPQAARRVNAARLLREVPEVAEKIASGHLSLTAASQAQVSFKRDNKAGKPKKAEEKQKILTELENKTTRQTEQILNSHAATPAPPVTERCRQVSENISELKVPLTDELRSELEQLKDIWSLSNLTEVIQKMAKLCVKQHDPEAKAERSRKTPPATPPPESRYIPAVIRHQVRLRDKTCTYTDSATGQRCASKHRLQYDHIIPFARGGTHSVENLRLRCHTHNQLHAVECFGPLQTSS